MIFKIRVILDTKEDVIRTLLIDANNTLEDLHKTITASFGFDGMEMASFYRSDDEWLQGEEIPLFSMDEGPDALNMSSTTILQNMEDVGEKMIYVYDYLSMWTFYCELIENNVSYEGELPKTILTIGEVPLEAPDKMFVSETDGTSEYDYSEDEFDDLNEFDDEFGDEFGESYDSSYDYDDY